MKKGKKLKERDKKGFKYYLKRDWQLYVLLFFPLAFAIVFKFLPNIQGMIILHACIFLNIRKTLGLFFVLIYA